MTPRQSGILITAVIIMIGVFYLATIRQGHPWDGDFGAYIHHAKNIAEGLSYRDTGYIFNPFRPAHGPKTSPPIYPLLLAPIYKVFGLHLGAMKVELVVCFVLSLALIFLIARDELPFRFLVALIAIIGFNPFFWDYKDHIMSDIPFLLFMCLTIVFVKMTYESNAHQAIYALLAGLSMYLAYGTRSVGLLLLPSLLISDMSRRWRDNPAARKDHVGMLQPPTHEHRSLLVLRRLRPRATLDAIRGAIRAMLLGRPSRFGIIATCVFLLSAGSQNIFVHDDSSYLDGLRDLLMTSQVNELIYTAYADLKALLEFFENGYSKTVKTGLFIALLALAATGYVERIRRRKGVDFMDIWIVLYSALLMIVAGFFFDARYAIPAMPLMFFYAFWALKTFTPRAQRVAFSLIVCAIFGSYIGGYTKMDFGPITEGLRKRETRELFAYITTHTDERDVFVFRVPRVLSLFTNRSAAIFHRPRDDRDLWMYFQKIGARYLVVGPATLDYAQDDLAFLRRFVSKYKRELQKVYSNADFEVYRIER